MKEEKFPHTRKPLHWQRSGVAGVGGKLQSRGGERSNRGAEGKAERFPHRGLVLASTHQPERLVCSPARTGWGLGAKARALEVRSQGEDWGWLRKHSLKGASVPRLTRRESEKVWNSLRGKRPLFWGAQGEGIQSTAEMSSRDGHGPWLSAWTPEMGMKC